MHLWRLFSTKYHSPYSALSRDRLFVSLYLLYSP